MFNTLYKISIAAILFILLLLVFGCASFKPGIEQKATLVRYQQGENKTLMELQNECGEWWRIVYKWYGRRKPMPMIIGGTYILIFDTTRWKTDADGNRLFNYRIKKA